MPLDGTLDVTVTDDGAEFKFAVENTGDDPVELTFRSGMKADFAALQDGEAVWRWSDGKMFTQALQSETLDPGEEEDFRVTWPGPDPGKYVGVATLESDPGVEARESFSV